MVFIEMEAAMRERKPALKRLIFFLVISAFGLIFLRSGETQFDLQHRITRAGLKIKILSVTVPEDRKPVVTFTISDEANNPLDRLGVNTMGPVDPRFIIARIKSGERQYTAYTIRKQTGAVLGTVDQATTDSSGTFTLISDGTYTYKFGTVLPENYEANVTHTVGVGANRNLSAFDGKTYFADDTFDFVPGTGEVSPIRDVVPTNACNQCHDPISAHGGRYLKVKTCVLCHQPQTVDPDTGNTVDFKNMIHKIHRGENLPSVRAGTPYRIIGFGGNVFDFSTVVIPQDIRNCTTCHAAAATQADNHMTQPSRVACGSCHDNVNFTTGENHAGIRQTDDGRCRLCHQPTSSDEFDISVAGAHTIPLESRQLPGVVFQILGVTSGAPGQSPVVTFNIKDKTGRVIAPNTMTRLALVLAGATSDYGPMISEDARTATGPDADGNYRYTFTAKVPADAKGSWAVGIEGYKNATLNPGPAPAGDTANTVRDAGINVVKYFGVTDSTPVARRKIVEMTKCNACHNSLSLHGGNRNNSIEHCVLCHNPTMTDVARRPADKAPAETIDFRTMIHKIHTGEELQTKPYVIYGFGNTPIDFGEVRYPADRRNCEKCHAAGTWLPDAVPKTLLPVITPRGYINPTRPMTAACIACHDSLDAAAHAVLNTTTFGEACLVCHGEGKDFAVRKAHSRVDTRSF
jgi:OmcA/MtrC family decaheme c-type cytochrome